MTVSVASYRVHNESDHFNADKISKIERHYNAKYVCETCIKDKNGNWYNTPVIVFYTEKAHPQGSNYFGLYANSNKELMITNAISALDPFDAVMLENEIFYSRYRHDYREHNGVFVDGGRDYLRCGGDEWEKAKVVKLQIVKDKLEMVE
jgi:hypothetical protein